MDSAPGGDLPPASYAISTEHWQHDTDRLKATPSHVDPQTVAPWQRKVNELTLKIASIWRLSCDSTRRHNNTETVVAQACGQIQCLDAGLRASAWTQGQLNKNYERALAQLSQTCHRIEGGSIKSRTEQLQLRKDLDEFSASFQNAIEDVAKYGVEVGTLRESVAENLRYFASLREEVHQLTEGKVASDETLHALLFKHTEQAKVVETMKAGVTALQTGVRGLEQGQEALRAAGLDVQQDLAGVKERQGEVTARQAALEAQYELDNVLRENQERVLEAERKRQLAINKAHEEKAAYLESELHVHRDTLTEHSTRLAEQGEKLADHGNRMFVLEQGQQEQDELNKELGQMQIRCRRSTARSWASSRRTRRIRRPSRSSSRSTPRRRRSSARSRKRSSGRRRCGATRGWPT